jgi:hypothetical protein
MDQQLTTIVTWIDGRQRKQLGVGEAATFGRTSASEPIDFRLHDSTALSRRAGRIEMRADGVLVVSSQRADCGAVTVLAANGTELARLSQDNQFLCQRAEFRVRVRVDGVGSFDIDVSQPERVAEPRETTTDDPELTVTEPWTAEQVLTPSARERWKTVVAIACVINRFGLPEEPARDSWSEALPTSQAVLRNVNRFLGTSYGEHWLSTQWDQAIAALSIRRTAGSGTDKMPLVVPIVISGGYLPDKLMTRLMDRLRELARGDGRP